MRLAIRKVGHGWQVYDLTSPWHSRTVWAYRHLAENELRQMRSRPRERDARRPARDRSKWITKAGRHGTLYRYAVTYTDKDDEGFGRHLWHTWAYDEEHALDRFYEDGDEGWKHLAIHRMRSTS